MLLGLDHIPANRIAITDSDGLSFTYGDICRQAANLRAQYTERTFVIELVENTAECAFKIMSMLASERVVPLILNKKTETSLLEQFTQLYGNANHAIHPMLSHLLPTSGSTGSPKLIRHSYDNIEAAGLNISTFFDIKPNDRPLMVLPLYYTMGLSILFSHLRVGATVLITNLSMTDAAFWRFVRNEYATSFTGVPYSYHILDLLRFYRMDLPELELLTQGGGKMPHDLNLKFATYCQEHHKRWIATYGQSECTARMAYLPAKWAVEKVGSIGIAVPNGEFSLIDENGNPIQKPHTEGELCYRGKNVTMGYATCKDDLLLGDLRNGYIQTGDIAYFDEDGCYYITGRKGRFLKLFGIRIGLDECEQIIQNTCQTECACVGTDEKMIVYVTQNNLIERVKEALIQTTHLVATAFEIRVINQIPKNTIGKKIYSQLDNK
ncbi:MAG: AMP-binding protein [Bacteroidales bacterium]|nr:AMP-binding protein [Candidatus Colicola equi]